MKKILSLFTFFFVFIFSFYTTTLSFSPTSTPLYNGIDVSQWQGDINYSQVSNSNIEIVYIKSSEGTSYIDPYFQSNYLNAKANNLKIGFYHFLTARTNEEAIAQANFFVSTIKGLSPDCLLAMDFEQFGNLSVNEINSISETFLEEVKRLSNKDVIIYSDAYNASNVFSKELASKYPIWVADYFVTEPSNGNWNNWTGFQYSNEGIVSGINSFVDKDYFTKEILLSDTQSIPTQTTPDIPQNNKFIIVQKGNTLSQIANEYNTSYTYLAKINNIPNPNLIFVGEKIYVPSNSESTNYDTHHILYTVKPGDTLTYISKLYGVSIESLVHLNNIQNPNLIFSGEVLRIFK